MLLMLLHLPDALAEQVKKPGQPHVGVRCGRRHDPYLCDGSGPAWADVLSDAIDL